MSEFEPFEEEEEPESLRRKWEEEEGRHAGYRACPHCGQPVEADSFSCIFCGERVFQDSGPLGKLLGLLKSNAFLWVIGLVLAAFVLMYVL